MPALANPEGDSAAIEDLFDRLGFETVDARNADARKLRRALERFVEDAEGADVAVLYYAGHGIEAGGENWLVPVDADLAALDDAGERLVPLSAFLAELQATVPLSIVMLDACRDNPFPTGALVRKQPGAEPMPIGTAGLGETRGAARLGEPPADADGIGTLVAFAAEPGRAALDGTPGGHSPYAAAVLRHLDAMAGEEFGLVMRMVGEEVYLRTAGRQRPWINESLHRRLYFGRAPEPAAGEEGMILGERRQLLLTIAALPEIGRRQVEAVAADGKVPMDALFGLLRALGTEAPSDPSRLDALLREQSRRLAEIMAERARLTRSDPEIARLASLAGEAIDEGALTTATAIFERAKARVATLSRELDAVESDIRDRRVEYARVYAESAAAYELAFDFAAAAEDYERAFVEVERWDDELAWDYRRRATIAQYRHGEYMGDVAALERIVARRDTILRAAARLPSELPRAEALLQIGNALNVLGKLRSDAKTLEEAIASYRQALPVFEAAGDRTGLSRLKNNLASALVSLGENDAETTRLDEAIALHRQLVAEAPFEQDTVEWMTARLNLASALSRLGERSGSTATTREAMEILAGIVERVRPEADPIPWALAKFNLAGAMLFVGEREGNPKLLADSAKTAEAVLAIWTREAFPLYWASVRNNIGNAYQVLGLVLGDDTFLRAAVYEYGDALEEWRRDRVPDDWARASNNLANVLKKLGQSTGEEARLEEAIALYRSCMEVWIRPEMPLSWASAQNNLGDALAILGERRNDAAMLRAAVDAFDLALQEWTRERVPYDWAVATNNRGGALVALGTATAAPDLIRAGIADIEAAWQYDRDTGETGYDDYYRKRLDAAKAALAKLSP
ncbi:MAG TPA: tetratricopeptide repeat protein [Rhizobiales bacterium]|nr:tetratricopeptide repeat protein [Hyphomicrobiales bacterium]